MSLDKINNGKAWFMRHGHNMLWLLQKSSSESEFPPSYNAFLENACGCDQVATRSTF